MPIARSRRALLIAALALIPVAAQNRIDLDLKLPQSPARPAPRWLKTVDLGASNPKLKGYFAPEGIRVEIVAESPVVINPVGMTFADDGTPYVIEWRPDVARRIPEVTETIKYKDGTTRKLAMVKKSVKDVVKTLSDTDGDGVYDKSTVILEDEMPASILLHEGWLYLSGRGEIRRYKRSGKDGPYDVQEVIAKGFCGYHHQQVSGMTIGNDGWLYVTSGDDDNVVEGSGGSRATVLRTGAVFRCLPDGSKMQVHAVGFRNPYRDLAFDATFNAFHLDNDSAHGSKFTGCRLMHVPEGADFGWRRRAGSRSEPDYERAAAFGELPGKMRPMLKTGSGAPAGLLIYNESALPERYRGLLYYPDVLRRSIRAYRAAPKGATFEVAEEFELLRSDDPLFRPCQMVVGPDGAVYVVDWRTDPTGANGFRSDGRHGRIYRITWAGTKDEPAIEPAPTHRWAKIRTLPDDALFEALSSGDLSMRLRAQREIVRRGDKHRPALLKVVRDPAAPRLARIAALGALHRFWNPDVAKACTALMDDVDPALRRLAVEALGTHREAKGLKVFAALEDADLSVARAAAIAIGHTAAPGAEALLANALAADDSKDAYLHDGFVRGLELIGKKGIGQLIDLAESGDASQTHLAAAVFRSLRTRAGAEAIPRLLANPHLVDDERAYLIRSYQNYLLDPPVSLAPLVGYLTKHKDASDSVQLNGLRVLASSGQPISPEAQKWIVGLLESRNVVVRVSAVQAIVEGRLSSATSALLKIVESNDEPTALRLACVKALVALNAKDGAVSLKALLSELDPSTREERLLQLEALRALGQLQIEAAKPLAEKFLEGDDFALQTEAVRLLGTDVNGAKKLANLVLEKKLPPSTLSQVSAGLRHFALKDAEASRLLLAIMKNGLLPSKSPEETARIEKMVLANGDPMRGRALFLERKTLVCMRCHVLEGVGGRNGPDLTKVWQTHSVVQVLESLIDPSKEIKKEFVTYVATTKQGRVHTGLKIAQTKDEVVLRDLRANDVRIPTDDLEKLEPSKQSLMPSDVIAQLSLEQLIDLVAFLRDRKAQESLRGLALDFHVVGPFALDPEKSQPPEENASLQATYDGDLTNSVLSAVAEQRGAMVDKTPLN